MGGICGEDIHYHHTVLCPVLCQILMPYCMRAGAAVCFGIKRTALALGEARRAPAPSDCMDVHSIEVLA
ncbi:MAG: hypothetical protein IPI63_03875 [Methanothrix sp.]|uniref:hypothetical protein n=1 Tax=Methanothrix sp. TaxID=90426 RepID=UPI0025F73247|nr:hypothetical protein [Methanothrix sp.]MBK7385894.1 hypothetical protein [Methanothrix sp.]HPW72754.1 hypothetical protein [Methanothrix sp.]